MKAAKTALNVVPAGEGRIAGMAREAFECVKRDPNTGQGSQGDTKGFDYGDSKYRHVSDRQEFFEKSVLMFEAETAGDALAQIVMAARLLNIVDDQYPEVPGGEYATPHTEFDKRAFEKRVRLLNRCLYSLRRLIERTSGLDAKDYGAAWYMQGDFNPFVCEVSTFPLAKDDEQAADGVKPRVGAALQAAE